MREGVTYKRLGEVAPSQKYDGEITSVSGLYWLLNLDMVEPNTGNVIKKVMATKEELDGSITSFSPNNVLYSKLRPYLNKVVLPDECGYCTTELVPLFPKKDLLSREYLAYFLRSNTFVEFINDKVAGAKMPRVKMSDFWNHPIPVPSLFTQELIVRELDSISSVISAKKQQVLELDNLAQAIFLDTFGDPITNPKGWEVKKLGEATRKIGSGATPKGGNESYKTEGIALIRSLNVHNNDFKYKDLAYIDDAQAKALNNVELQEQDVLLNITGASVARCCILPSHLLPARVNQHVSILRTKYEELLSSFLCFQLISPSYQDHLLLISKSGGATREALTKTQLENLQIILPPLSLQQAFAEKVQAIEEQKRLINQSIAEFESLLAQRMEFHFA